jgi:hypothetical protein
LAEQKKTVVLLEAFLDPPHFDAVVWLFAEDPFVEVDDEGLVEWSVKSFKVFDPDIVYLHLIWATLRQWCL